MEVYTYYFCYHRLSDHDTSNGSGGRRVAKGPAVLLIAKHWSELWGFGAVRCSAVWFAGVIAFITNSG